VPKKKKYDEIYKENTYNKMLSEDPNDPYLYVPSVENTPMNITASRPFWLGDQKLVTFKFSEKDLEILEIPTDPKFSKNPNNFSPVMKLAIEHKSYRCKEDDYGDCTNKEEEVDNQSWQSKPYFKTDFTQLTVLETNTLPEQLTNLFQKCFSDRGSVVKFLEISKDALNVTIEKTITADIACSEINAIEDLRNLTFKVNYHYSFVKLSKIASKNYQKIAYPHTDQNKFGFFSTTLKKLTADNRETLDSDQTMLNRWSPTKKKIIYYLNESFYDKDMSSIKDATHRGVDTINKSLKAAKVNFQIELADGRNKKIGDLRNSFIILEKDPQASGVIGYGPSITNPLTGEIVKAQVVMYYGTIRKFIQETYEELVKKAQDKIKLEQSKSSVASKQVVKNNQLIHGLENELKESQSLHKALLNQSITNFHGHNSHSDIASNLKPESSNKIEHINHGLHDHKFIARIKNEIFSTDRKMETYSLEDTVEEMSRNNLYHHSMFNWNSALLEGLADIKLDLANAKPWNDLSENEKEKIITQLMPYVWIPTLVHEFGHNLGLRHNFNGSEDKDNFYNTEELSSFGLSQQVSYSSIMDYSYSSVNQLPIMGKYDIASLRFGYAREIELTDGTIKKLSTSTIEDMKNKVGLDKLKNYEYCTDEHVAVNPGCNRFDEGTSLKEIAEHYVKAYGAHFEKRNKRNNRLDFSATTDANYYLSVRQTFQGLRIFFEVFERIKAMYPSLKPEQWESIEFLKDLKVATEVAFKFYIDVIKTQSVHCAIASKETNQLVGILPLEDITFNAIDCFDQENLNIDESKYVVVAKTGKHFNHAKGPELRGDIGADPTQLSQRGIWIDKILAMDYLLKRDLNISTFDANRTSFIDHSEFSEIAIATILELMNDKIHTKAKLETADQQIIELDHIFDIGNTHNIVKSFAPELNSHLGIKKTSTDMRELLFIMLKNNLKKSDDELTSLGLAQSLSVTNVHPLMSIDPTQVAAQAIIKDAKGRAINRYLAFPENSLAITMIKNMDIRNKLEAFERAKLVEIYTNRVQSKVPNEIPENEKEVYDMDIKQLLAFLRGEMPSDNLLNRLFGIMNQLN
jgi:hypothetical protein